MGISKQLLVTGLVAMLASGCDFVTDPDKLAEFQWGQISSSEFGGERIQLSTFGGQISLLGESLAPDQCYEAVPNFSESGRNLTLRVSFRSTRSQCDEGQTPFRWLATIRNLEARTYIVRAVQSYQDGAGATVEVVDTITFR